MSGFVLAAEPTSNPSGCCETTNRGDTCVYTTQNNCAGNFQEGTQCEDASACNTGCCVVNGQCGSTVSSETCQSQGGTFFNQQCSAVSSCSQGCCQIGNNFVLTTALQCSELTEQSNIPRDQAIFLPEVIDELSCSQQELNSQEGCCVDSTGLCTYTTKDACAEGNFQTTQCSNVALCGCKEHASKQCINEDVYWFDSCGNKEEIAQDCDYAKGTLCSQDGESASCISVDCTDTLDRKTLWGDDVRDGDGVARKNGESWCEYDGAVGLGRDLVGSRHYRHLCVNGKEIIEPCRDYREEYCIEGQIAFPDGTEYNQARCAQNNWEDCTTTCNSAKGITDPQQREAALSEDQHCCQSQTKSCFWQTLDQKAIDATTNGLPKVCKDADGNETTCVDTKATASEGVCLPLVPPGGVFWTEDKDGTQEPSDDLQKVCEPATQSCTVYFSNDVTTGFSWEVVGNEQCLKPENFIIPAQASCNTYGDCGVDYNVAGKLSTEAYDCSTSDGDCSGNIHGYNYDFISIDWDKALGGKGSYSKATPLSLGTITIDNSVLDNLKYAGFAVVAVGAINLAVTSFTLGTVIGAVLGDVIGFGIVAPLVALVTLSFSAGAAAGEAIVGLAATIAPDFCATPPGIGCIIGAVIAAVLITLSFLSDTDELEITNTCNAWQPPTGGQDCELCRDPEIYTTLGYDTCSEYRCKSLGTTCTYLKENEGSPRNPCLATHINDASAPIISPDPSNLTKGFKITSFTNGYEILPATKAYTPLSFGILTSESARCRMSESPGQDFENMTLDFGDTYFSETHSISVIPTPATQNNFYVRCEDINGNQNEADYLIKFTGGDEPDLTPPIILDYSIKNGAAVRVGTTPLTIELNEPATCMYGINATTFDAMKNSFSCSGSVESISPLARYSCDTTLTVHDGENLYGIACQDLAGNINTQPVMYTLFGAPELHIDSIQPNGTLETNHIILEVSTSGGINNGISNCTYDIGGKSGPFNETGSITHRTELPQLSKGTYTLKVTCDDSASSVTQSTTLTLLVDDTQPTITNFYTDGSVLIVLTDEESACQYSKDSFTYGNGTYFESTNDTRHLVTLSQSTYHIICGDEWNNINEEIIVVP